MLKIKSDDEVIILAGKDKGKRGKVRTFWTTASSLCPVST